MAFTTSTTTSTTTRTRTTTASTSTSTSTSTLGSTPTTLFVSSPIDPNNQKNDKFFFASKMNQKHDVTNPALAVAASATSAATSASASATSMTTDKEEYFRDRIAFARQRALMASLAKNRESAMTSTTTLNVIRSNKQEIKKTIAPPLVALAPPTTPTTPIPMDQQALQARQSYFKQRIQLVRQRALMANIKTAKQAQTRTTDTLQKTTTTSTTKSTAAAATAPNTTNTLPRNVEERQRALFKAQLAYNSPTLQAQRKRQAYFAKRIQASRQRALLASIAGAVANKQSLTTDTLKSSSINAQRSKRTEAAQRALFKAQLQQRNNNKDETTTKKQPQTQKPAFQISSRKVQIDRQTTLLQEIQAQMSQTTKQRIMGNKAARKAARMANRQTRKDAQQQQQQE